MSLIDNAKEDIFLISPSGKNFFRIFVEEFYLILQSKNNNLGGF